MMALFSSVDVVIVIAIALGLLLSSRLLEMIAISTSQGSADVLIRNLKGFSFTSIDIEEATHSLTIVSH